MDCSIFFWQMLLFLWLIVTSVLFYTVQLRFIKRIKLFHLLSSKDWGFPISKIHILRICVFTILVPSDGFILVFLIILIYPDFPVFSICRIWFICHSASFFYWCYRIDIHLLTYQSVYWRGQVLTFTIFLLK